MHADDTVTFRLRSPSAGPVLLSLEGAPSPIAMMPGSDGVWQVTVGPLAPEYYGYSFLVDGVGFVDPNNSLLKPNLLNVTSMVHVPGPSYLPWERNNVPHGVVHHHFYHSDVVGDERDYFVYTPPGYAAGGTYPVLYLLHGFSDDASAWTAVGRANVILDNLIASHQARPMVVVMPLGYGQPEIVRRGRPLRHLDRNPVWDENVTRFGAALLTEVMPRVESEYHVGTDPDHRAIAGLSMGGAESLLVGLNHPETFGWIGSFSAGGLAPDYAAEFPQVNSSLNGRIRLLWIACGTEDHLLGPNRRFRAWLAQQGVAHVDIETPGMHDWMVWRANLAAFAPLLFTH
ncbi:MAG TPA: alpha/beta hydrolase-fold protein [Opitutaceae bacterium]|nr:alpha/beta hydrolase-fold protein [Opitutaceae bacterium]